MADTLEPLPNFIEQCMRQFKAKNAHDGPSSNNGAGKPVTIGQLEKVIKLGG